MDREALARKCARIEKAGGSVREYLGTLGFISPWGTWFRLQKEELGRKDYQITDGKGVEEMRKVTLEDKKKAVEIAMSGGNPLKFLKECGVANPSASWAYIKKTLKEVDPEKYARLPSRANAAEPECWKPKEAVTTCCAPARPSGVEVPDEWPEEEPAEDIPADALGRSAEILEKAQEQPEVVLTIKSEDLTREIDETPHVSSITKPVNYDGFDVMALKSPDTGFRFTSDPRYGMMTWNTVSGDEVSLTAEEWHKLAAELPKALQIFGI